MTTPARHTPPGQDEPLFYSLPAALLDVGMSTDDGQDILTVNVGPELVVFDVYTPSDDPDEDTDRRLTPEARAVPPGQRVTLAVFGDTAVNASTYPQAIVATTEPDA